MELNVGERCIGVRLTTDMNPVARGFDISNFEHSNICDGTALPNTVAINNIAMQ